MLKRQRKRSGGCPLEASTLRPKEAFSFEISLSLSLPKLLFFCVLQILTCAVHAMVESRRECVSVPSRVRWPSPNAAVPIQTMVSESPASHALLKTQVVPLAGFTPNQESRNVTLAIWPPSTSSLKCFVIIFNWRKEVQTCVGTRDN